MSNYLDEVTRLQAEKQNERALRAEAEAEADAWRQKTIDVKLDSIHKRRGDSIAMEEIIVDSRSNRTIIERDDQSSARLKKEVESLKSQRELLLRTLEDMQTPEEESEEDKSLPPEEKLERERERRRAAEGMAKALRAMLEESEANRTALQEDAIKLKTDSDRSRSLLAAAQDIMVQNRIAPPPANTNREPTMRITAGDETSSAKHIFVCIGLVAAVVAVAALVSRKRRQR